MNLNIQQLMDIRDYLYSQWDGPTVNGRPAPEMDMRPISDLLVAMTLFNILEDHLRAMGGIPRDELEHMRQLQTVMKEHTERLDSDLRDAEELLAKMRADTKSTTYNESVPGASDLAHGVD